MKYKFKFSYAEVETIFDYLSSFLNSMRIEIMSNFGDLDLIRQSVAFKLYVQFFSIVREVKKINE